MAATIRCPSRPQATLGLGAAQRAAVTSTQARRITAYWLLYETSRPWRNMPSWYRKNELRNCGLVRFPVAGRSALPDSIANAFPRHLARCIASGDHVIDLARCD